MPAQNTSSRSDPDEVVIDTNVVLDWLVFGDAATHGLSKAIAERRWRWVATPAMLTELERVLFRMGAATEQVISHARRVGRIVMADDWPPANECALRCSDADDQKYIDLAISRRARFLLSRDKALLALARWAASFDVTVCRPLDIDWPAEERRAAEAARRCQTKTD